MWMDLECRLAQAGISAAAISSADRWAADHRRSLRAFVNAGRYHAGEHRLDLANERPAELLAFCVAVETGTWGSSVGVGQRRPALAISECREPGLLNPDCFPIARVGMSRVSRLREGVQKPCLFATTLM